MPSARRQAIELAAEAFAQGGVERGQGLVEQEDARTDRHRTRQRHALTLAAGKLVDAAILEARDVGQPNQFGDARGAFVLRHAADFEAIADIVGDAHIRKQRVGLEDHADIALFDRHLGHVLAVEQYLAALIRHLEAGDDAKHGGLAAAGGPEQHQRLAARDVERCGLQCPRAIRKGLAAILDAHGSAVSRDAAHRVRSFSAKSCMATSSGMIMMKKISV